MTELAAKPHTRPNPAQGRPARRERHGVEVAGLRKRYGDHPVLTGVDLQVPEGSITAILGPSGSGKTTLLRLLAGFTRAEGGTITIDGRLIDGPGRHTSPAIRGVGYVPQEGSLFPHLDVAANIGFGLPRARQRRRVAELVEMIGLNGLSRRYPHQLSGGQQQRVALARALAPKPSLVLLDEPFSSLDAALRASVRLEVTEILADAGTTTVIVTHDQDEALSMADQVAVLRHGQIAQAGHPQQIYNQPLDAELARFVGEANLIEAVIRDGHADTVFGPLPLHSALGSLAEGGEVTVLLRPEQIEVVPPISQTPQGVVTRCDYHGHDAIVTIAAGVPAGQHIFTVRTSGFAGPTLGSSVGLRAIGPVTAWPRTVSPPR